MCDCSVRGGSYWVAACSVWSNLNTAIPLSPESHVVALVKSYFFRHEPASCTLLQPGVRSSSCQGAPWVMKHLPRSKGRCLYARAKTSQCPHTLSSQIINQAHTAEPDTYPTSYVPVPRAEWHTIRIYIYIILGLALSPICWVFDFRALFLYTYNHDPCSVNRPEVNPPRVGLDPKNGCVFFLVSRLHEGHGQVQSQTPGDDADHFSKAFDCNRSARQLNRWEIRPEPM